MLELQKGHLEAIKAHAEADYPHECGGLLLGHLDAENDKTVVETLPMENTAEVETRHDRVLIDPRALMLADRKAREKGLDVIGYYHSHPDDEAVPSQFDLDHALPVGHTLSSRLGTKKRSIGTRGRWKTTGLNLKRKSWKLLKRCRNS